MNTVHPCRGKNNGKKWAIRFGYPSPRSYIYPVNGVRAQLNKGYE